MQNNFELIVALTFLMCVVCSHYQYSFFMFYIILFSFYVFLFYFLERKTEKGRKKKETIKKKIKKVKPFWSNYFFRLINQGNGSCN